MVSLDWYRTRLENALSLVESTFPHSAISWRETTPIRCEHQEFPCIRVDEIRSIGNEVVRQHPKIRFNPLGKLLDGQTAHYEDAIHPGEAASGIYLDTLLYTMQRVAAHPR